jgi:hypothetical protein
MMEAVRQAVIDFNRLHPEQEAQHRRRLSADPRRPDAHRALDAAVRALARGDRGVSPRSGSASTRTTCCRARSGTARSARRSRPTRSGCATPTPTCPLLADAFGELAHGFSEHGA